MHSSHLAVGSTNRQIRSNRLYRLPLRFYVNQFIVLALMALVFTWLSRDGRLDSAITNMWYDSVAHRFPLQHNQWLELINHKLLKDLAISAGAIALIYGLIRRHPRLIMVGVLVGMGALAVGVLKATSHHSCPWDLIEYGGKAVSYPLFSAVPADSGPGRCFPGGHASSGFMVMGFFFLFWREKPRLAWAMFAFGATLGLVMGFGQIVRGAHFLSHNLWAGWWVWFTQLAVYAIVTTWLVKDI